MDKAKQHWEILQGIGTDLANRVREFMVIGKDGEGLLVATEDGLTFWLGTMKFESGKSRTVNEPTQLNVSDLVQMAQSHNVILLLNKRVRCGGWHCLALTEDGKVWAWGSNVFGQVGVPKLTAKRLLSPFHIPELDLHRIIAVECGAHYSLALTDRGEVYAWGVNNRGQLGDGSTTYQHTPTRIPTPSPVQSIAAGESHTLLLTQNGEVWACGWNELGQLGRPTTTKSSASLVKVDGLPSILQIASHPFTQLSIAMSSDQRCFVWGQLDNEFDKKKCITVDTPRKLPLFYSTVESPLSFYSLRRYTPHSVTLPVTPPSPLSVRMSRMFDNPEFSDVQFVVEQRTIHAHRIILSKSSDYFALMFSERWMVPVDTEDPIIKVTIPDHSYQVFHSFLSFLYTDSLEVHSDLLPEMFELACLYLVPYLQHLCLSRMRTTITPATCCLYYPLTHRHSLLPELATFQQELVQFASTRMSEVVHSAAYQSMEFDLRDHFTNAVQNFPGI